MDKLISYIQNYGLSILVIAVCIIAIVGILKLCKVFDKIKSDDLKKFIYYAIDVVLAFAGSAIYFAIFHKDWNGYAMYSLSQLATTLFLYAFYEQCGVRKLVRMLISVIAGWIKKNPETELAKWAEKLGLTESIEKLQTILADEKAKEEQEATKREEVVIEEQKEDTTTSQANQQ